MAQLSRAVLKALWIKGYKPLEADFDDFFDSFLNIQDDGSSGLWELSSGRNKLITDGRVAIQTDTADGSIAFEIYDSSQTIGVSTANLYANDDGELISTSQVFLNIDSNSIYSQNVTSHSVTDSVTIGKDAKTGTRGTALGYTSGNVANDSACFGYYAGPNTGNQCTCIGASAMSLGTGIDNTAIGTASMRYAAATRSTAVGVLTGENNPATLIECVMVGHSAMRAQAASTGGVAIGFESGYDVSADYFIYLGYQSGYYESNDNRFIVSNQKGTNQATAQAAALMYGTMDATTANQLVQFNSNLLLTQIKSGATQGASGAVANEVWKTASHATLPDNVLMIGV